MKDFLDPRQGRVLLTLDEYLILTSRREFLHHFVRYEFEMDSVQGVE